MADHFLTKTQVELADCLPWGPGLALDAHAALHAVLSARVSPEVADLFAEPLLNRGNDAAPASIAWYCAHEGEGHPLSELDGPAQARVGALLSQRLQALRGLLADSEDGTLIGAALHLADSPKGDIWVVAGQPVILNWGMVPHGMARDPASRAALFARTLGRFLPLKDAPPLTEAERAARAAPVSPAAVASAAPPPEPAAAAPAMAAPRRVGLWDWLPLLVLVLLAGAAVVWLLIPGNRLFPPQAPVAVEDARAAEILAESNAALIERRDALRAALEGAQCRADGTLIMPGGRTIEGLLPPVPGDRADGPGASVPGATASTLPPDPARVQVPEQGGAEPGSTAIDNASLLEVIERRTVMVIAQGPEGLSTGSGFFVAPDLVMTNFHVVEGAAAEGVFVTNAAIGALHAAQVVRAEGPFEQTGTDFALLRVPGVAARHFPLYLPQGSLKLQSVIAAGFPGDVLATDTAFAALQAGDVSSVPDLTVTDGTVSTEQTISAEARAVVHSAPISQGNSGGPLVDVCGRVVGMNTFVRQGNLRTLNFALSAADVARFLRAAGVTPMETDAPCTPEVRRPGVAPEAAAPQLPDFGTGSGN